jgi:hypothetical protein
MSFIVATADTIVFRVEVSNVVFLQNRPDPNQRDFFFTMNFDNFRRQDSAKSDSPRWENDKIVFMYQTRFADQLVGKYLTISVNCSHSAGGSTFCGQAVIDLLTLATGPLRVVLTTSDGDFPTGKIQLHVDMLEVMDAAVAMEECVVTDIDPNVGTPVSCTLTVAKRGSATESFEGIASATATATNASFAVPIQRYALDATTLHEGGSGMVLSIAGNGSIRGSTVVDFGHLFSLYSTGSFEGQPVSNSSVTSMIGEGKKNYVQEKAVFDISRELTVDGTPTSAVVGNIKFLLKFDGMPSFAQMKEGIVVDGRVWKGKTREGFPAPPFMLD